jgi:1A family penicillin-binding protein
MKLRTRLKRHDFVQERKSPKKHTFSIKGLPGYLVRRFRRQLFYAAILLIAFLALVPPATYLYFAKDLKDKQSIMSRNDTGLTLLTRDNEPFFTFYQPKKITYEPLASIPTVMQQAAVASEDKDFYNHSGFSIRGIARAFVVNLFAGKIVEGGSTITQELAKNAFLNANRNFLRKYQEIVLAAELDRRFSKQDILEVYLNSVYFGEGAFGIENAAQTYFGVSSSQLTLPQAAMLVGILPAPSAYSPLSNDPQRAINRRNTVLEAMADQQYITQQQADDAKVEPLNLNPSKISDGLNTLAPHFAIYVKNELIKKYGEERLIREGFKVQTTLNKTWQEEAERVVNRQVLRLKANNAGNGAAVAIDPKTGEIEAMVGSFDWDNEEYGKANMAVTPRQPGSSFKPLIYATALEEKLITPATIIEDNETTFPGGYKPHNYDKQYHGNVTVRRALSNSMNIPAVKVMDQVGVEQGLNKARQFGITTLGPASNYGLSLVLGAGEVKLLELTNAYAVFANQGMYHEPKSVLKIENKYGQQVDAKQQSFWDMFNPFKIFQINNNAKKVLDPAAAFLISSILSDNKSRAQVFGSSLTISRPAAVKTGTTDDYKDALTVGYTPSLVVGVWVGNNDNTAMDNIAGSLGAAPIWRSLMETFLAGTAVEYFSQPAFVVSERICLPGMAAYTEYFIAGTQTVSCGTSQITSNPTPTPLNSPTPTPTSRQDEPTPTPSPTPFALPTSRPFPTSAPAAPQPTSPPIFNIPQNQNGPAF